MKYKILAGRIRFFLKIFFGRKSLYRIWRKKSWIGQNIVIELSSSANLEIGWMEISSYSKLVAEKNSHLIIEDGFFCNRSCSVICKEHIHIGANTIFGESVKIYDHDHVHIPRLEKEKFNTAPIHIGKQCWICSNVTILKGVTIGDNVTIGANCVVFKDIPENSIVLSNGFILKKDSIS